MQSLHMSPWPGCSKAYRQGSAVATTDLKLQRRPLWKPLPTWRASECGGLATTRVQSSNSPDSQPAAQQPGPPSLQGGQQSGMYYSSNPPQKPATQFPSTTPTPALPPQQHQYRQPEQYQQQSYQQQVQYAPQQQPAQQHGYIYPSQTSRQQYPVYQPSGQSPLASPSGAVYDSGAVSGLNRVNPGKTYINSVTLLGIVDQPRQQGRCVQAMILVPFATKPGSQDYLLEAWDNEARELMGLHGIKVVVEGRLSRDVASGEVKVVAYRIKLVDETRQVDGGRGKTAMVQLDPQEVWRTHYETQTQTIKGLASQFGCTSYTIQPMLLKHAFKLQSPLRWRALAEEAGLGSAGDSDGLTLADFMAVVTEYQKDMAAMQTAAHPDAAPPPLPVTNDGMLKVKPIRDWALSKGEHNPHCYVVATYEARYGNAAVYYTLRLAAVAEATQGAWDYEAEFGPQL